MLLSRCCEGGSGVGRGIARRNAQADAREAAENVGAVAAAIHPRADDRRRRRFRSKCGSFSVMNILSVGAPRVARRLQAA